MFQNSVIMRPIELRSVTLSPTTISVLAHDQLEGNCTPFVWLPISCYLYLWYKSCSILWIICTCFLQLWQPKPSIYSLLMEQLALLLPTKAAEFPAVHYAFLHALFQDCHKWAPPTYWSYAPRHLVTIVMATTSPGQHQPAVAWCRHQQWDLLQRCWCC